tara:strand:- start:198 stop:395 length:198 start_codon:yes stop_codon:yes gene_type:complete
MANKRRTPPPFLKGHKIVDEKNNRHDSLQIGRDLNAFNFDLINEADDLKGIFGEGAFNAAIAIKG